MLLKKIVFVLIPFVAATTVHGGTWTPLANQAPDYINLEPLRNATLTD
jgi:hypothetical protein